MLFENRDPDETPSLFPGSSDGRRLCLEELGAEVDHQGSRQEVIVSQPPQVFRALFSFRNRIQN